MEERHLLGWVNSCLKRQSSTFLITLGLLLILVIGIVDYLTGTELSISIFYVLPISLVAWSANRRTAIFLSVLSFAIGLVTDLAAGHRYSNPVFVYWNNLVQLGFFIILVAVLSALRAEYEATVRVNAELKRAQRDLERKTQDLSRSNRELEHFAYVAAHDLRGPLVMAGGCIHRLKRVCAEKLDGSAERLIGYALDAMTHMEALINSLLTYARVGPKTKNLKLTNCNDIIHRATASLQREIERTGAVITSDELPTLWADDTQFSQLFQNLIGNGIKFCRETSPSVHVSASQAGSEWIFTVRDNGVGIDLKDMNRIFEMFQRLQNSSEYEGHGIGLAICKKIVENHGGRIWVISEPGRGSTFHFSIPTVSSPTTGQE